MANFHVPSYRKSRGFVLPPYQRLSTASYTSSSSSEAQQVEQQRPLSPGALRLKRFLAFCLAIDYKLSLRQRDLMDADDMRYFVNLANTMFSGGKAKPWASDTVSNDRSHSILRGTAVSFAIAQDPQDFGLELEIRSLSRSLLLVINELGVPLAPTMSMLRIFISSLAQGKGAPESRIKWLCRTHGIQSCADELQYDKGYLFSTILRPEETPLHIYQLLKFEMDMVQQEHHARWFTEPWGLSQKGKNQLRIDRNNERYWVLRKATTYNKRCELGSDVCCAFEKVMGRGFVVVRPAMWQMRNC